MSGYLYITHEHELAYTIRKKRDKTSLGELRWNGHWGEWDFEPQEGTYYTESCLKEITSMLNVLNKRGG